MKIYLAKEQSCQFSIQRHHEEYHRTKNGVASILAEMKPSPHSSDIEKEYCTSLAKQLETTGLQYSPQRDNSILVTLSVEPNVRDLGSIKIEGGILNRLASAIKKEPEIKVKVKNFHCTSNGGFYHGLLGVYPGDSNSHVTFTSYCKKLQAASANYQTRPMHLNVGGQASNHLTQWKDSEVVIPYRLLDYWALGQNFSGLVSITVILDNALVPKPKPKFVVPKKLSINKKILTEEIESDLVMVASNGVEVKCHKTFLAAQSPVLQAMLRSELSESKSGKVKMVDMNEKSVKAFLAYLYYWDVSVPNTDPAVAYELLHAGHKYDIGSLEDAMTAIFLEKDIKWYTVEAALQLFLFVRNLQKEDLKMAAIKVLKTNFSALEASKGYQLIFLRDPTAAMELCKYAFST